MKLLRHLRVVLMLRRLHRGGYITPDGKGRYRLTTKGRIVHRLDIYGPSARRTP